MPIISTPVERRDAGLKERTREREREREEGEGGKAGSKGWTRWKNGASLRRKLARYEDVL